MKLKQHAEFKANTRQVQGETEVFQGRTQDKSKVNTRCFKAEHRTSPLQGEHEADTSDESTWNWLEVGLPVGVALLLSGQNSKIQISRILTDGAKCEAFGRFLHSRIGALADSCMCDGFKVLINDHENSGY